MTVLTAKLLQNSYLDQKFVFGGCHLLYIDNHPTYYILTQLDAQVFIKKKCYPPSCCSFDRKGELRVLVVVIGSGNKM